MRREIWREKEGCQPNDKESQNETRRYFALCGWNVSHMLFDWLDAINFPSITTFGCQKEKSDFPIKRWWVQRIITKVPSFCLKLLSTLPFSFPPLFSYSHYHSFSLRSFCTHTQTPTSSRRNDLFISYRVLEDFRWQISLAHRKPSELSSKLMCTCMRCSLCYFLLRIRSFFCKLCVREFVRLCGYVNDLFMSAQYWKCELVRTISWKLRKHH